MKRFSLRSENYENDFPEEEKKINGFYFPFRGKRESGLVKTRLRVTVPGPLLLIGRIPVADERYVPR